jgi:hypothetical protein
VAACGSNNASSGQTAVSRALQCSIRATLVPLMRGVSVHGTPEGRLSMTTYALFISHSWSYSDTYEALTKLLTDAPHFFYKNYSVPKDDPIHNAPNLAWLYQAIKKQAAPAQVVVILVPCLRKW